MKKTFGLIVLVSLISSCATQTNLLNDSYGATLKESGTHGFWIAGIAQTETVNLDTACGEGYVGSKTETVFSAKNILITIVTLGIYTQRDYKVYCTKEAD
jgi:hypothetical protein|tara:strand:- start:128 stop:427 length:300 start_codon:yes stop_codon:yes gene_type:complete